MAEALQSYAGEIAFSLISLSEGEAVGSMRIRDGVLNPFGTVHAGALLWFADVIATHLALGAVDVAPGMKGFPLAVNLNAQLLANRREGELLATARVVRRGRRVSVIRTTVADAQGGGELVDVTTTHIAAA